MTATISIDDTAALPTFESRFSSYLRPHGVDLSPGEFLVREARFLRCLAGTGLDAATLAERLAFVEEHPQLLLGDEWGPTPFVAVDWEQVFPRSAAGEEGAGPETGL